MRNDAEVVTKDQKWWDLFYLRLCREYSTGSKDPSSKVAAAIVRNNRLLSIGYNGLSELLKDDPEIYNNREKKLEHTVHAEVNAIQRYFQILNNNYRETGGNTLYVYPYLPCSACASYTYGSGIINRVVSTDYEPQRWQSSFAETKEKFNEYQIPVVQYPINQVL